MIKLFFYICRRKTKPNTINMKKTLSVICMAALCCTSAMAQFNWGVRGGLNLVNNDITLVDEENVLEKDNYTGFFFGPMAEFQIPVVGLGIDASLLYQQKGLELTDKETMKQQQIAVPVYLKYSFGLGDLAAIFAQAGVQLNYNIGDLSKVIEDKDADEASEFILNKNTWTFNVGAGVKLMNHLQAAVNYNMPLSKEGSVERKGLEGGSLEDARLLAKDKFDQSTLQFSVTYTF